MFDYTAIAVAIAGLVFFAKAGQMEGRTPLPWIALSAVISALVIAVLHRGWLATLGGQLALFFGIAVWRVARDKPGEKPGEENE